MNEAEYVVQCQNSFNGPHEMQLQKAFMWPTQKWYNMYACSLVGDTITSQLTCGVFKA